MARTIRPRALGAAFGVFFAVIALIAWNFASGLPTPWYGSELSRWIYTTNMVVAAIFLMGLGGLGLSIRKSFNRQIRELERRGPASGEGAGNELPPPLPETASPPDRADRDIDELLQSLSEIEASTAQEAAAMEMPADVLRAEPSEASGLGTEEAAAKRLRDRHRALARYLIGPGVVAAAILGIGGMMLPGTDAFTQSNHQLNTALILGIAYSWGGLGAYVAATMYALVSPRGGSASAPANA